MTFEKNPDFLQLPAATVGDIVHLKHSDGFSYVVKAIVTRASPDQIEATVQGLFDSASHARLVGSELMQLVGTTLTFPPEDVHNLISRNGAA